jgi:hypothetical protein
MEVEAEEEEEEEEEAQKHEAIEAEDTRVEAVNVDYYMNAPLPSGSLANLSSSPCYLLARQVPVIRIYGATPAGQKAVVHVHGVSFFLFQNSVDGGLY